jgi:hypothetical protein
MFEYILVKLFVLVVDFNALRSDISANMDLLPMGIWSNQQLILWANDPVKVMACSYKCSKWFSGVQNDPPVMNSLESFDSPMMTSPGILTLWWWIDWKVLTPHWWIQRGIFTPRCIWHQQFFQNQLCRFIEESRLPGDEYTGESRHPCDDYNGESNANRKTGINPQLNKIRNPV